MANPERGAATRRHNTALAIDFEAGVAPDELTALPRKAIRNLHVSKLYEIVEALTDDTAEVGKLYVIGQFAAPTGAKAARSAARRQLADWPPLNDRYAWEVLARRRPAGNGNTGAYETIKSELLAGVMVRGG